VEEDSGADATTAAVLQGVTRRDPVGLLVLFGKAEVQVPLVDRVPHQLLGRVLVPGVLVPVLARVRTAALIRIRVGITVRLHGITGPTILWLGVGDGEEGLWWA
jgi:hypothetical protein